MGSRFTITYGIFVGVLPALMLVLVMLAAGVAILVGVVALIPLWLLLDWLYRTRSETFWQAAGAFFIACLIVRLVLG
jgi:hypothetical protein